MKYFFKNCWSPWKKWGGMAPRPPQFRRPCSRQIDGHCAPISRNHNIMDVSLEFLTQFSPHIFCSYFPNLQNRRFMYLNVNCHIDILLKNVALNIYIQCCANASEYIFYASFAALSITITRIDMIYIYVPGSPPRDNILLQSTFFRVNLLVRK